MSFCSYTQAPLVGPKKTNCLGFIRKDAQYSHIDAISVEEETGDCCCPEKYTYCLKLPCDLTDAGCQCLTTPLIDSKTGEPFRITKGCLLDQIIVAKCKDVCLDNNLKFILGVLSAENSGSACNRWVAEGNQVCGDFLNCACFIKIDAASKCRNVQMQQCETGCAGGCGGCGINNALCSTEDDCATTCGAYVNCDGVTPVTNTDPCYAAAGPCPLLRYGELEDTWMAITVCDGALHKDDLTFTVECWELSGSKCGDCSDCAGPRFAYGY